MKHCGFFDLDRSNRRESKIEVQRLESSKQKITPTLMARFDSAQKLSKEQKLYKYTNQV